MISGKPLKDIFRDVREEVKRKLKESTDLADIKSVVFGERIKIGNLQTPAIWIVPESYTPELRGGHTASHDITFSFVVLVKTPQPQEGLEKAQDLAMTVYDVFTSDRTLSGLVSDVRPTNVDPAYEMGNSTQVYWSAVQFAFRLQRRE
ncbi:hypothetical protein [Virgibacillus sp. CBA3643]|uniref:hypothetical protein n=1 Tax=Virgibacillus sp. CBA3643 TaxID=2942278 RepID=UPI0035A3A7F5